MGKRSVMETGEGACPSPGRGSGVRAGQQGGWEQERGDPGPPVLLGWPRLDLSQLRTTSSVNFTESLKPPRGRGRLSGRLHGFRRKCKETTHFRIWQSRRGMGGGRRHGEDK